MIDFRCSFLVVTQRKALREVEAHLVAEHRQRAGAGAVVLLAPVGENAFHQVEVLAHGVAYAGGRRGMNRPTALR